MNESETHISMWAANKILNFQMAIVEMLNAQDLLGDGIASAPLVEISRSELADFHIVEFSVQVRHRPGDCFINALKGEIKDFTASIRKKPNQSVGVKKILIDQFEKNKYNCTAELRFNVTWVDSYTPKIYDKPYKVECKSIDEKIWYPHGFFRTKAGAIERANDLQHLRVLQGSNTTRTSDERVVFKNSVLFQSEKESE